MTIDSAYNYARNKDKLLANLINIIEGLTCDGRLSESEVLFLDTWLLESESLSENYYVQCIRSKIFDILADGRADEQELTEFKADLLDIQRGLMDTPNLDLFSEDSDKHLLEGLCKGMAADYHLSDDEIYYLKWFLSANSALKKNYPGKHLYRLVQSILSDGVITNDERAQLLNEVIAFTGSNISEGIVDGLSTTLPNDLIDKCDFNGKNVCLTGKFLCGSRRQCSSDIEKLGGKIVDSVTQKLDVLIVGALSSKDWKFQSFGRKIEMAVDLRDNKNIPLIIISEEQWQSLIQA